MFFIIDNTSTSNAFVAFLTCFHPRIDRSNRRHVERIGNAGRKKERFSLRAQGNYNEAPQLDSPTNTPSETTPRNYINFTQKLSFPLLNSDFILCLPSPFSSIPLSLCIANAAMQSATRKSSSTKFCYHVFINHRGKDVKHKLARDIYNTLVSKGLKAFLDQEELELGECFPDAIIEAVSRSPVHIAILSPRYAESAWCLEELSWMLQTKSTLIPVFYRVQPTELRFVATGVYADAFVQHEKKGRYSPEKIEEWKEALRRVSFLNGRIVDPDKCDRGKLMEEIVDTAVHKIKNKMPLEIAAEVDEDDEITVGCFCCF